METRRHRGFFALVRQMVKFGIVGFLAFCIDFGLFLLLTYAFGIWYIASSTVGFVVSTVFNYVLSMRYVFQGKETQTAMQQFTIFFVLSVIGLLLNQLILWACGDLLGIAAWAGKLIATFLVMAFNFVTRKIFLEDHSRKKRV